jgi:phage gpG-like protein
VVSLSNHPSTSSGRTDLCILNRSIKGEQNEGDDDGCGVKQPVMDINIQSNIDQVINKISRFESKGQDLSPLFCEIANELLLIAEDAFEKEQSAIDDSDWADLSKSTLKQKKGKGRKLQQTGAMKDSLMVESTRYSATIGVNIKSDKDYIYPAVHQFGSKHVEARPFLPFDSDGDISDELRDGLIDLVADHFSN